MAVEIFCLSIPRLSKDNLILRRIFDYETSLSGILYGKEGLYQYSNRLISLVVTITNIYFFRLLATVHYVQKSFIRLHEEMYTYTLGTLDRRTLLCHEQEEIAEHRNGATASQI